MTMEVERKRKRGTVRGGNEEVRGERVRGSGEKKGKLSKRG